MGYCKCKAAFLIKVILKYFYLIGIVLQCRLYQGRKRRVGRKGGGGVQLTISSI